MIREYLENVKEEYLRERIDLMDQESALKSRLKENKKMIQMLDENSDPTYAAFTPRQINPYNENKIQELKQEQRDIVGQLEQIQKKVFSYSDKIDEIEKIIQQARENEQYASLPGQIKPLVQKIDSGLSLLETDKTQAREEFISVRDALKEISSI